MWGKLDIKVHQGKPTHASIKKNLPKGLYTVESSNDAIKPFNLVYVNTAHATYKNAYVKNASLEFGDANDTEGDLGIVEPRLIRTEGSSLLDINTVFATGAAVEITPCLVNELYWVRPASLDGTSFTIGDKLKIAAGGTVEKLESNPSNPTSKHGHVFIAMENHTFNTSGVKTLLLVRYGGIQPYKIAGA